MRERVPRIREGLACPAMALNQARSLAEEAVRLERVSAGYVGAAIDNLTREGDFGSWLKKLYRGDKVTIHLHFYERLCRLVEDRAEMLRKRADHAENVLAITRGSRASAQGNQKICASRVETRAA